MKVLLGQLEELAWNLPPGPLGPTPDLFGDGERPRSGEDSSGWGRLPATAQVWPGRAGTGLGSSWGGVGRHPPHTHTQSVLCPYPRLGALQPGIWSGLLEGLAQFTWLPPGTALAVYRLPPGTALAVTQPWWVTPPPPRQSSWAPFRSLARSPSCATTEPPTPSLCPVFPGLGGPGDWEGRGGQGPAALRAAPLFQMALEHPSLPCPAAGSDTRVCGTALL